MCIYYSVIFNIIITKILTFFNKYYKIKMYMYVYKLIEKGDADGKKKP